ncbi:MAG: hypothetical protein Q9160_000821 [Pyrenula sp. 1 TL-2023]
MLLQSFFSIFLLSTANAIQSDQRDPAQANIQEDSGKVNIQPPKTTATRLPMPIVALSYTGDPGPKACRGSLMSALRVPRPVSQAANNTCYDLPRVARCGIFMGEEADACEARLYAESGCPEEPDGLYMNTVAFIPEDRANGGSYRSMLIRCGISVEVPKAEFLEEAKDSYSVTRTIDGLPYFLSLTDTAGQEEYRGLWAASNLQSDAFLLVYDITNPSSLDNLAYFMDMIDVESEQRAEDNERAAKQRLKHPSGRIGEKEIKTKAMPVKFVAGNKCDLKDARAVTSRQGLEWARRKGCGFMETSAREMVNIEETFALIVRRVVEARREIAQNPVPHRRQQQEEAAKTAKASKSNTATTSGGAPNGHAHSNSYSATKPLPPPEGGSEQDRYEDRDREKAAMEDGGAQRRPTSRWNKKRRPVNQGFWARLFGFCRR